MEEIVLSHSFASVINSTDRPTDKFHPITRRHMIPASDYYPRLAGLFSTGNEIFPRNCRMSKMLPNGSRIVVLEEDPGIRTVSFDIGMESIIERFKQTGRLERYGYKNFLKENKEPPYRFRLAFPYVILIMTFGPRLDYRGLKAFYRLHPLGSPSDYLLRTNLLNTTDNQYMCIGSIRNSDDSPYPETLIEACEQVVEKFWMSRYNTDYNYNYNLYEKIPEVCDPLTWQYHTAQDPLFVFGVKWKAHNRTLIEDFEAITGEMTRRDESHQRPDMGYDLFRSLFTKAIPTGQKNVKFSVADETMVDDMILEVGDQITIENKKCFVNAFYGTGSIVKRITGMTVTFDGEAKSTQIDLTSTLKSNIGRQLSQREIRKFTFDGKDFKKGDILIVENPATKTTVYKKISKIRVARDGLFEVRLGNDWYLLDNVEFNVFDKDDLTINGIKINAKKPYIIIQRGYSLNPIWRYWRAKFDELITSGSTIRARFRSERDKSSIDVRMQSKSPSDSKLVLDDDIEFRSPPIFRHFLSLSTNPGWNDDSPYYLLSKQGVLGYDTSMDRYDKKMAEEHLLNKYGTALHIPSWDMDINFKIGDPVVIADWENTTNMMKVSVISGFTFEDGQLWVTSTWIDNKDIQFKVPYVDLDRNKVWAGTVRHIIPEFGGWKAGDKVRSKVSGIAGFPKKDTNAVIGFLPDTGTKYPLILFSNLCTLWAAPEIMAKFTRYQRKSIKWYEYDNAPISLTKLKLQPGDIMWRGDNWARDTQLNFFSTRARQGSTREFCTSLERYGFDYVYDKQGSTGWKRYGFLSPRFSQTQRVSELERRSIFPNFHGGYTLNEANGEIYIPEEWEYVQRVD